MIIKLKNNDSVKQIYGTINTEYLDPNVKPQEDFFQFANGNWVKNTQIPSTESRWGSFNELDLSNKKKLIEILENAKKDNRAPGSLRVYGPTASVGEGMKLTLLVDPVDVLELVALLREINKRRAISKKPLLAYRVNPYSLD